MASSNFLARMSSLLDSWNQESRNLSSRWRFCSAKMPAASVRSTLGPALGGASWESTTPSAASTVSFALQQGQVTWRASLLLFFAISIFYASFGENGATAAARDSSPDFKLTLQPRPSNRASLECRSYNRLPPYGVLS